MRNIRNSCLSVDECDTPDEMRKVLDDLYAIAREHRTALEALDQDHTALRKERARLKKGGKTT